LKNLLSRSFGNIREHKQPRQYSAKRAMLEVTIPDFNLYYKAIAIKTTWYWYKNRYEDWWNRIEDPEMNPLGYTHLFFDKGIKIYDGEMIATLTNAAGKAGYVPTEK
jgi:hypothetical protein